MDAWDPIGIADVPQARDEYDRYIPQLLKQIRLNKSKEDLADYLICVETEMMGLSGNMARARRVATRLKALELI